MSSTKSPSGASRHSPAIPELLQVDGNRGIEPRGLGLLFAQRRGESLHLLLERLAVGLLHLRADIAAGREDVAVLAHLLLRRTLAEAGHVGVRARLLLATPGVVRGGDAGDVLVGQLAMRAVHHAAELAGIDEEHVAAAVA